jgi:hypothetical protein
MVLTKCNFFCIRNLSKSHLGGKENMMKYDELHSRYFENGLKIRAICDDLAYPEEYAQILLYIHIRGTDHYSNKTVMKTMAKIIEEYYHPDKEIKLKESSFNSNNHIKSMYSDIIIGKQLEYADNYLSEKENKNGFFSKQISNILRLYTDTDFREKMLNIYEKNIKKLLKLYNKEKIEKAFKRARLLKDVNFN